MFSRLALIAMLFFAFPSSLFAQDYAEASVVTSDVASRYLDAYIARDWDALEPLLADEATFRDPTAKLVFGGEGATGKAAMMTMFRQGYSAITDMGFEEDRRIVGGTVGIFEGTLTWTALHRGGVPVTARMPFVLILELEDGKVVSHRDYGDYTGYLAARAEAFADQ